MKPCPLCEGNAELPPEQVAPLLRVLLRRLADPGTGPWHVNLSSGEIVEARILSDSEVALLGLESLAESSISPR